jgi:hypothetical protein
MRARPRSGRAPRRAFLPPECTAAVDNQAARFDTRRRSVSSPLGVKKSACRQLAWSVQSEGLFVGRQVGAERCACSSAVSSRSLVAGKPGTSTFFSRVYASHAPTIKLEVPFFRRRHGARVIGQRGRQPWGRRISCGGLQRHVDRDRHEAERPTIRASLSHARPVCRSSIQSRCCGPE